MLIDSEQSMAREHSDGSATEREFMASFPFVREVLSAYEKPEAAVLDFR
jgi:hypothetical protein